MCVGVPARVESIADGMASVDAMGVRRSISVELLDRVAVGDYVMIHAGIAIARITAQEADETRELLEEINAEQ
ncbi:MAG: HypC/HybG/HupF family hydrogenase formation chaperone [Clostridia bacterium]|nr:HypC/HybG/HupF family hydrogenase formation chaperone [Clostridia bacterium]MDR3643448.1 HypC/HybG/HupF family hydrogenase formation chaperone [Clostridia bacterium]